MLVHFKGVVIVAAHDGKEEGGAVVRRVLVGHYELQDTETHGLVLLRHVKHTEQKAVNATMPIR